MDLASPMNAEVFISFKNSDAFGQPTQDRNVAGALYEELSARGIPTFQSNYSLLALGESAYKKSIDSALDATKVLVVVASSLEYLNSEWVKYEWEGFHHDILSGTNPGAQIIPYFGAFSHEETPRSLRNFETFHIGTNQVSEVADFVQSVLKKIKSTQPAEAQGISDQRTLNIQSGLSTTKVRQSLYTSDSDREYERLMVQSKNTHACDMAVLNKLVAELDRPIWVLDLGCAYNYVGNMRFGNMENVKVLGVDISDNCLEYAVAHSDPEKFVFRKLNLEDDMMEFQLKQIMDELGIEKFDIMFGALLLLHLKKPIIVLKRLRKFLARDGYIVIRGSDDGSVLAINDNGLVEKIIQKCHTTVGFSDRQNGRKLYHQLESAGYRDVRVETFIKDLSGKDIDERDEIFFERFSYRINNFRKILNADPHNIEKRNDYDFMRFALEELEEMFTNHDFWYCEHDFIAYGRPY